MNKQISSLSLVLFSRFISLDSFTVFASIDSEHPLLALSKAVNRLPAGKRKTWRVLRVTSRIYKNGFKAEQCYLNIWHMDK